MAMPTMLNSMKSIWKNSSLLRTIPECSERQSYRDNIKKEAVNCEYTQNLDINELYYCQGHRKH